MKKKMVKVFCLLILVAAASFFAHFRTEGFSVSKIISDFSCDPLWDTDPLPESEWNKVVSLLDQKFTYLGSGRQCFVFQSEDEKYVIKFLNHERFFLSKFFTFLPAPAFLEKIRQEKMEKRHKRIEAFFKSFHIGYQRMREETGILYLQLNRSKDFQKHLTIVDKIGYTHQVDLNEVEFLLQKKADMIYPTLDKLAVDKTAYKKALDSFLDLLTSRVVKGIVDDDLNVPMNIGYLEGRAILIDIGRLFLDPSLVRPERFSGELMKSSKFLRRHLAKTNPEMASYLEQELQKRIESYKKNFFAPSDPLDVPAKRSSQTVL